MRGRHLQTWGATMAACLLVAPANGVTAPATTPPRLVHMVRPEYPKAADENGIEGSVDVDIIVAADGSVQNVIVIEADPPQVFERAATTAVARWSFEPARIGGIAVPAHVRQHILFEP